MMFFPGSRCALEIGYAASEQTDYALVEHGERRGLPCVEIEVRQDLIAHAAGQAEWAERLSRLLERARPAVLAA